MRAVELQSIFKAELKNRLRKRGLPVGGTKVELIQRLESSEAGDADAEVLERPVFGDRREPNADRGLGLGTLKIGDKLHGKVVYMNAVGAYLDVNRGQKVFLHVSRMSTGFVQSPGEILHEGKELDVWVSHFKGGVVDVTLLENEIDKKKQRRSSARQQQSSDKIRTAGISNVEIFDEFRGTVVKVTNYAAMVEVTPKDGSEVRQGLLHVSELGKLRKGYVVDARDALEIGEQLDVIVKGVNLNTGQLRLCIK